MLKQVILGLTVMMLASCNLLAEQTATPTQLPTTTVVPSSTTTATATASATAAASPTSSDTAAPTQTPTTTPTATITPTAPVTPFVLAPFRSDTLELVDLPENIRDGIANPLIVFTNSNDQQSIRNIATAQPENTSEQLYFTPPGSRDRILVAEFDSATDNQIYIASNGKALAYFRPGGDAPGLYILNIATNTAFSNRVWTTNTLVQRGLFSPPTWTTDGEALAVTLATYYALDIFLYTRDGSNRINLTDSGAYDFWPAFSPDGRYMAFVSDRGTCPTWVPGEAGFCDYLTDEPPIGGTVHLMNIETGEVRQINDVFVTEAPRWINSNLLVIAGGDQTNLLNPQRTLWLANIRANTVDQVRLTTDGDDVMYLADAWAPDGQALVVQRTTTSDIAVVLMTSAGSMIRSRSAELTFPRFGMHADWSPQNTRIAIGGVGGRCPYGIRVAAADDFSWIATGNQPAACDPIYSPTGDSLAFTGITSEVDGRLDVYSASVDGFGIVNLTGDLRGTMNLIGWIGG